MSLSAAIVFAQWLCSIHHTMTATVDVDQSHFRVYRQIYAELYK